MMATIRTVGPEHFMLSSDAGTPEIFRLMKEHNVALRGMALERGLSLSEKGFKVVESGELLPDDRYESWATEPRGRLQRRYLDVLRAGALWDRLAERQDAAAPA